MKRLEELTVFCAQIWVVLSTIFTAFSPQQLPDDCIVRSSGIYIRKELGSDNEDTSCMRTFRSLYQQIISKNKKMTVQYLVTVVASSGGQNFI